MGSAFPNPSLRLTLAAWAEVRGARADFFAHNLRSATVARLSLVSIRQEVFLERPGLTVDAAVGIHRGAMQTNRASQDALDVHCEVR